MSARSVSPLVRWSTNHRLTELSCAIVLFSGWVISQPDAHQQRGQDGQRGDQLDRRSAPSERPVGGEKRPVAGMRRIVPYVVRSALHRKG